MLYMGLIHGIENIYIYLVSGEVENGTSEHEVTLKLLEMGDLSLLGT